MLTTKEVARLLSISVTSVGNYCRAGLWYAVKSNPTKKSVYRIPDSEIERTTGMKIIRENGVAKLVSKNEKETLATC